MRKLGLAFALAAMVLLAIDDAAIASHARPKNASPVTFKLVPAFKACTTGTNGTHGAPLALPSCSPPVPASRLLTFQAPDRPFPFNTPANGAGQVTLKSTCVSSSNPLTENGDTPPCSANVGDQADMKITFALTDVRCAGDPNQGGGTCAGGNGTAGAGSLYSGKVITTSSFGAGPEAYWRITDHDNYLNSNPPGTDCTDFQSCPATAIDIPFEVGAQCSSGACSYTTGADAVVMGMIKEGKRMVVQLGQLQLWDAGNDGNLISGPPPSTGICPPACTDNDPGNSGIFLLQGLFLP
jgi:hypothetical protein